MGGSLSNLKRQEQIDHLRFTVANFERLVAGIKEKPTADDQMDYWRFVRDFKRVYADLIKNNPTDSEVENLLTRYSKANKTYCKLERPESYEYPVENS